jgi:hypothetical protein
MRLACLLVASLVVVGCSGYQPYLPDGGRARVNCQAAQLTVPVTVLDRVGDPSPLAVVEVEYTSLGESENVIADGRGIALVADKGPGIVRLIANVNDLRSGVGELTFVGTECSSAVSPRSITLQVR